MDALKETPSRTVGPYVHIGPAPAAAGFDISARELGVEPIPDAVPGPRITVTGRVIDGLGAPVRDVLIEVWQADARGRYPGDAGTAEGFAAGCAWCPISTPASSPSAPARMAARRRTCRCGWSRAASTPDCRRACISRRPAPIRSRP